MLNNEDFANEDYEVEIITLEDDLGNEQDFEFLDVVEYDGDEYIILLPVEEEDEEQNEVMILRIDSIDDETENYIGIDDEEILQKVFDIFKKRYEDEFDFEYPQKLELDDGEFISNELHTIDMRELAAELLDDKYLVKHYKNRHKPYDHYICPWHDDKQPSAMAYEQLFICTSTNCDVGKLDQEAFIKKVFGIEKRVDVLQKFIEHFV